MSAGVGPLVMRVVAGTLGGRSLRAPRGRGTRPTSDRVREAVFSMLGVEVAGARVLDLFAGSGALGIEALSRGASSAVFVESDPPAITAIRENLESLGLEADVVARDVRRWLASAGGGPAQYDLVFVDPPYRLTGTLGPELASTLPPLLAPGARLVLESDRRAALNFDLPLERERRYGDTLIRIHANR